jgi:hypothetical protein
VHGDLLNEDVRHVRHHDALLGRRLQVDAVYADAAGGDHLTAIQLVDDVGGQPLAAGHDRVGVPGPGDVLVGASGPDRLDGDAERLERLVLIRIVSLDAPAERRGNDLERHGEPSRGL